MEGNFDRVSFKFDCFDNIFGAKARKVLYYDLWVEISLPRHYCYSYQRGLDRVEPKGIF